MSRLRNAAPASAPLSSVSLVNASRSEPVQLDAELVEAIAVRVAELLHLPSVSPQPEWMDAAALARHLGVSRGFVYEHQQELGARPLGSGPKPRLRFNVAIAEQASCFTRRSPDPASVRLAERKTTRRQRRPLATNVELLPVRPRRQSAAA
jgi:hypothetical protein